MSQNNNSTLFIIGIIALLVGTFGLTFGAFFAIIGLPIFIIGILLIVFSKSSVKAKIIWIFSCVLAIITFWVIWFKMNKTEPTTYLIPKDFNGRVTIIHGLECGITPEIENGRKLLKIPNDGILFVDYKFKSGFIDHEYYLSDKEGKRVKIKDYENYQDNTKNIPGIGFSAAGNFPGEMPNGGFSSKSPETVYYTEFRLIRDSIIQFDYKEERRIDSIIRARIEDCKKSKTID